MSETHLPQTDSIRELARFWDTHDVTDFQEELEEVPKPVFEREVVVRVPLPEEEARSLATLAQSRGVAQEELVRQWVLERVHGS